MTISQTTKLTLALILPCLIFTGCGGRLGYTPDIAFTNPETIGTHKGFSENNGMLYTLRGGHVDLAHVRGPADQTKAAYSKAYKCIVNGKKSFTVIPAWERIINKVTFEFPEDWKQRPEAEREQIAYEMALMIAPVVGYNSSLYHEMLTWKGAKFFLIEPEAKSSFSWEDLYSNVMGSWLAVEAIKADGDFNTNFTELLNQELQRLEVVSKEDAKEITASVKGEWYTLTKLNKKNMDSHIDGDISPSLVPGYTSEAPINYPLPTLDGIENYDVKVKYTITSMFLEHRTLKKMAGTTDALEPTKHFRQIMLEIQKEGEQRPGLIIHK